MKKLFPVLMVSFFFTENVIARNAPSSISTKNIKHMSVDVFIIMPDVTTLADMMLLVDISQQWCKAQYLEIAHTVETAYVESPLNLAQIKGWAATTSQHVAETLEDTFKKRIFRLDYVTDKLDKNNCQKFIQILQSGKEKSTIEVFNQVLKFHPNATLPPIEIVPENELKDGVSKAVPKRLSFDKTINDFVTLFNSTISVLQLKDVNLPKRTKTLKGELFVEHDRYDSKVFTFGIEPKTHKLKFICTDNFLGANNQEKMFNVKLIDLFTPSMSTEKTLDLIADLIYRGRVLKPETVLYTVIDDYRFGVIKKQNEKTEVNYTLCIGSNKKNKSLPEVKKIHSLYELLPLVIFNEHSVDPCVKKVQKQP